MEKYDLAIIGAGPGGLNSAYSAVAANKKVLLIEKNKLGGECTWSGCIPSKALIQLAKEIKSAQKYATVKIDGISIMNKVRSLVEEAHQAESIEILEKKGINYKCGEALFKSANILVINGDAIWANEIIIATGSSPIIPDIKGLNKIEYLTNENIFKLKNLPKSMIVLGAGAIGVELSQALQRLGVDMHLIQRSSSILSREEPEFALAVQHILSNEGVKVYTNSKLLSVSQERDEVKLTIKIGDKLEEIYAEMLLVSLRRQPNTHTLNLDDVGIVYNAKGIQVDEFHQTNIENIYAIGDVVGEYLFSHTAGYQARSLIENLYDSKKHPIKLDSIAWCTFTDPEFARCGLSEQDACLKHGQSIKVFTSNYTELDRAVVDQKTCGMVKVICDSEGYILGASILGERACELLCELQVMKQNNIPFQKLMEAIHPYPGYSEILLQLSMDAYNMIR